MSAAEPDGWLRRIIRLLALGWNAIRWAGRRLDLTHPAAQLGLYTLVGLGLLTLIHALAAERIAANHRQALLQSLYAVVPAASFDNAVLDDAIILDDERLGGREPVTVYRARQGGQPVAAIFTAMAPDGYNGSIQLLAAIRPDGILAGVSVLEHHETPGLGDRIESGKSAWLQGFVGRSLQNPPDSGWGVKRDGGVFDQFTGATITPRAVVKAVQRALRVYADRRASLWRQPVGPNGKE